MQNHQSRSFGSTFRLKRFRGHDSWLSMPIGRRLSVLGRLARLCERNLIESSRLSNGLHNNFSLWLYTYFITRDSIH
jgi:hypothetical protein